MASKGGRNPGVASSALKPGLRLAFAARLHLDPDLKVKREVRYYGWPRYPIRQLLAIKAKSWTRKKVVVPIK